MSKQIETIDDLKEEIDGNRFAMVSTIDERGTLSSRPVTIQEVDGNGDVWFLVDKKSEWVAPLDGGPINAAVSDDDTWVSFAGRASLVSEPARIKELEDAFSETYFDDDSEIVALRLVSDRIEWWVSASKPVQLIELAKAKVTGDQPDIGDSGTIET